MTQLQLSSGNPDIVGGIHHNEYYTLMGAALRMISGNTVWIQTSPYNYVVPLSSFVNQIT